MALTGIPISDNQCIGDSLDTINNAFIELDERTTNVVIVSSVAGQSPIIVTGGNTPDPVISLDVIPINKGGTGFDTAAAAFSALAPSQTGNGGGFLTTDGVNASWSKNFSSLDSIKSKVFLEEKSNPVITSNTLNLNLTSASLFYVVLSGDISTFILSNPPASPNVYSFVLQFEADGSTRSVVWPTSVKWPSNTAPTITSTNGKVDTFSFLTHDGGTTYYGFISDQNF